MENSQWKFRHLRSIYKLCLLTPLSMPFSLIFDMSVAVCCCHYWNAQCETVLSSLPYYHTLVFSPISYFWTIIPPVSLSRGSHNLDIMSPRIDLLNSPDKQPPWLHQGILFQLVAQWPLWMVYGGSLGYLSPSQTQKALIPTQTIGKFSVLAQNMLCD